MLINLKKLNSTIVILALLLISLDAYSINDFPIQYIGFIVLFFLSIMLNKNNILNLNPAFFIVFTIMFVPLFFSFNVSRNFNLLNFENIRVFNFLTFFVVFIFFYMSFNIGDTNNFFSLIEKLLVFISLVSLYVYFAQIFDFPELNRNRSGTNLLGNSLQTTFWPYQSHRLLGTFREPLLFVSFISPLYLLTLKFKKVPNNFFIFITSLCIGLTGSDLVVFYFLIFISLFIFLSIYSFYKKKTDLILSKKLFLGLVLPILFSFLTIIECNINPQSSDCVQFEIENNISNKIYNFDTYQNLTNLDLDRLNILNFFTSEGNYDSSLGFYEPTKKYSNYVNFKLNIEQYLTNRTLPEYLSTRYLSQNFGTGNYSYLKNIPNFQNLFIYIYLTYGSLLLVIISSIFIFSLFFGKSKLNSIFLHMIIFLFFLIPIEELTAFTGFIFGICYKILSKEILND